jgi:chaperonin GroES
MATATKIKGTLLGDRIMVKPIEKEEARKSGLIIPDTAKEKPQEGVAVSVGAGKTTDEGKVLPMHVKEGDKVLYGKYSGTEIKIDDQEYVIIHQDDVLMVLDR